MNRNRLIAFALAFLVGPATAFGVPTLSVTGGSSHSVPNTNSFYFGVYPTMIESGSLTLSEDASLSYEFLGREAAYNNSFIVDEMLIFSNQNIASPYQSGIAPNNTLGSYGLYETFGISGNLDFAFGKDSTTASVFNNANPGFGLANIAFILLSPSTALILFDDYGAGIEDNHDDMVIKLTAAAVPEPATAALMFSALGFLGFGTKRRKMIAS